MIQIETLSRYYADFKAVDSVSFEINPGEIVGLLGHNGAGKTTIMKMMTGYLEPSQGTVRIDGLDLETHRRAIQAKIGYLPENNPTYPDMTVLDYLEFVADLRALPADSKAQSINQALEKTDLKAKANQLIGTLSHGYRQRVGVAQAILHNPEILILDEPTNGLDPSQIHHMRTLIKDMGQKSTVILSTHIMQEVQAVCDRVIIILNGRLALDSRLADLQKSSRILLSIDQEIGKAQEKLVALKDIKDIHALGQEGLQYRYSLELAGEDPKLTAIEVIPQVVKTVMAQKLQILSIYPEKRDLETVFREVNEKVEDDKND